MKRIVIGLFAAALLCAGFAAAGAAPGSGQDGRTPFPKPASHKGNWSEYHGRAVGAKGNSPGQPGKACLTCHEQTDCFACHTTTMPRSHNNAWRVRGHGLTASGSRERCLACHREDYCIRCHSETAPRSHTAGWRNRHCTVCHFGPGKTITGGCAVCHKQATHVP
jgi:hypothetical protein